MANSITWAMAASLGVGLVACQNDPPKAGASAPPKADAPIEEKLAQYTTVRLTTALGKLSDTERRMIPVLIDAARSMDAIFWRQAYGNRDSLLRSIPDPAVQRYADINYGSWDRLADNAPFVDGVGPKPKGAGFYPPDMTKEELEAAAKKSPAAGRALRSQYTVVQRDSAGGLLAVPYHQAYADRVGPAAAKLREASRLAEDPGLRRYLELRARALETDDYRPSDLAWLEMKNNTIDAGDANAGSKTIAINLPNDEDVQLRKGTRRLQLKNSMQAKFDKILVPTADELIAEDQLGHIKFDAFFSNVMFHEVAHGLGIKSTIDQGPDVLQ